MNKYTRLDLQKGHEYCVFWGKKERQLADLSNELRDKVQKGVDTVPFGGPGFTYRWKKQVHFLYDPTVLVLFSA